MIWGNAAWVAGLMAAAGILMALAAKPGGCAPASPLPQPEALLGPMLAIAWERGPNLPQGFQDSDGGFLGTHLITVGGFCQGADDQMKPGRYPRGFLRKAWAFDTAAVARGWIELPDYPASGRQGLMAAAVDGALHCWGGFNYTAPFTYADGYRLRRRSGAWEWDALPRLPWPLTAGGIAAIGAKIYIFGGADYAEDFRTDADRNGDNPRLGARLLVLDTADLKAGWRRLSDCPGTPRLGHAMAAVDGKLHVIGGLASVPGVGYATVVDNWRYDPATDTWQRIRDLPIASGNFPDGRIVFADRYIVLVGGYQYSQVANPDGTYRPPYGTPHKYADEGDYFNDVFVYDTRSDLFGRADFMPINNNCPFVVARDEEIYIIGGEADAREMDGEYYGHHPDLFLRGKIATIHGKERTTPQ
ncbi:MAG: hypothetical protein JSV65_16545 [Armatimonadota bacterium]|nr:MAG: hypothetical protein JSV65_16545 [Armatimonadota bacterium]